MNLKTLNCGEQLRQFVEYSGELSSEQHKFRQLRKFDDLIGVTRPIADFNTATNVMT